MSAYSSLPKYISHMLEEEVNLLDGTDIWIPYDEYEEIEDYWDIDKIKNKEELDDILMVIRL